MASKVAACYEDYFADVRRGAIERNKEKEEE
jgi:hypothetical protein